MVKLNRIPYRIERYSRNFIKNLDKGEALLPVILLETAVTGGRTYQAYKRDGFIEARERATEETLGAIFWLGGVNFFNMIGDIIGKKTLGLAKIKFDVGKDSVRNPIKNFMKTATKHSEKTLAIFKLTKVISSILIANSIIGFVVPKLNQAITRKYQASIKNADKKAKSSSTSFKGLNVQQILSLSNSLETDARYKLISTDAGIVSGRTISARNKYERREIMFRDISSIYFYLFCRAHLNSLLNLAENGRTSRLDPWSAKRLDAHLRNNLQGENYSTDEFRELALGKETELPENIQKKFGKQLQENGVIKLNEFLQTVGEKTKIAERAKAMSGLQPEIQGEAILTAEQIKDVYNDCLINNPRILSQIFHKYTDGASSDPFKFVAEKDLRGLKQRMIDYVEDIIKKSKASGKSINADTLQHACKMNLLKNGINMLAGFAVSAYFLSTAIPKIQYWLTKEQTGKNKFPGIQNYTK